MKIYIKLLVLGLSVILGGCALESECGECFTPPGAFWFEVIDMETEQNTFTNSVHDSNELTIINENDGSNVEYFFIDENDVDLISITSIGWQTEKVTLSVQVSGEELFKLYVDAERLSDDCCSFTIYNEITIENADYKLDANSGVYSIYID